MHVHANDAVISESNSIANNKPPSHNLTRPSLDVFCPFGLISRACPVITKSPKLYSCNNMKYVASFYYKFLRTHHARGECYHFGTGIPSISKVQCTTQRVNCNRDLFKTLTSMNVARDHHNRIIYRFIEL